MPRWGRWALLGAALVAAVIVTLVVWRSVGDPEVSGDRLTFEIVDDSTIELRFEVTREDSGQPAVCIAHAQSIDGRETGRREVLVPPSDGAVRIDTVIRTSQPPVTADIVGCSLNVPDYLRSE